MNKRIFIDDNYKQKEIEENEIYSNGSLSQIW